MPSSLGREQQLLEHVARPRDADQQAERELPLHDDLLDVVRAALVSARMPVKVAVTPGRSGPETVTRTCDAGGNFDGAVIASCLYDSCAARYGSLSWRDAPRCCVGVNAEASRGVSRCDPRKGGQSSPAAFHFDW